MTALGEYSRLEAIGLWREQADDQRREVIVSLGEATLIMSSAAGDPLGHWSLPAVARVNPGKSPALYTPDAGSTEELEIADPTMVEAIERIRAAVAKTRPRPGRLRLVLGLGMVTAIGLLGTFWLPDALTRQTVSLVPDAKRVAIGQQLLLEMTQIAGRPCGSSGGRAALTRLSTRVFGADNAPQLVVFPATIPATVTLPGDIIVASAALAEDFETPEVLAGYLLAEQVSQSGADPVATLLRASGLRTTFRLLTTGQIADDVIHTHAANLLSREAAPADTDDLLEAFAMAQISSQPYAFARDVSGETVLGLIEGDPMRGGAGPTVLSDSEWVSLQEICVS